MKNYMIIINQTTIDLSIAEKHQTDRSTILVDRYQETSSQC